MTNKSLFFVGKQPIMWKLLEVIPSVMSFPGKALREELNNCSGRTVIYLDLRNKFNVHKMAHQRPVAI